MSKPYPRYKPSGIYWPEVIPDHWKAGRIKHAFDVVGGSTPKSDRVDYWDGGVTWVTPTDLSKLGSIFVESSARTITEAGLQSCGTTLVPEGSVVLSTRAPIGSLGIAARELCTNQGCKALVPKGSVIPFFLAYLLSVRTEELNLRGRGATFLEISGDELGRFEFALPPLEEQRAIATFLDRETAKIDALVDEQRRLIDLLKEKRQAVISHAVTKGLDPSVPMRDSGVEWLGEIPAHWETVRLKHLTPEVTVGIVVEPSKYYVDEGIPALRSLNVAPGSVSPENLVFISKEANELLSKSKLQAGDLVAVRTGQPGTCAVVPAELDGCNCIDLIIIRKPVGSSQYLRWFLSSDAALRQFSEGSEGAIQQHFNVSTAKDLMVVWPPRSEQAILEEFLQTETRKLDAFAAEAVAAMELLTERRSALISAAVTGKIDVRELLASSETEAA